MTKRLLLMVSLALSLVAFFATEAPAVIRGCTGGSCSNCDCNPLTLNIPPCTLCGKCVEGYVRATGLGNVENTPTFVILRVDVTGSPEWAVACGNPGTNNWESPGINLVSYGGQWLGVASIDPGDVSKNGTAYVKVPTQLTTEMMDELGDLACPNDNWIARDALPCVNTDATFEEVIKVGTTCYIRSTLTYKNCSIDGCPGTVEWDKVTQTFKPLPYTCPNPPEQVIFKTPELNSEIHSGDDCPPGICFSDRDCTGEQTGVNYVCTTTP